MTVVRWGREEIAMYSCVVCHGEESREEPVDEVFDVDGRYVLVCAVPSTVCSRCGERSFSRGTTEKVRTFVNGDTSSSKPVTMDRFEFA